MWIIKRSLLESSRLKMNERYYGDAMHKVNDFMAEIIATWQRDQDGLIFCIRRDGRTFYKHGPNEKFLPGGNTMEFKEAEKWAYDHCFYRTQKVE